MPYYNSQDIESYIRKELQAIDIDSSARVLTPISQPLTQLKNEEDLVGFCYTNLEEKDGISMPQMTAKVFYRIDADLYTDDRFAVDLFQASKEGKTVSEIIQSRHQEQQQAIRELSGEDMESISKLYERTNLDTRGTGEDEGVQ
jgi:hypothetical protein